MVEIDDGDNGFLASWYLRDIVWYDLECCCFYAPFVFLALSCFALIVRQHMVNICVL